MEANNHYSVATMMRGAQLFADRIQAEVDTLIIELNLEGNIATGEGLSKANKVNRIIEYAKNNPEHETMEGSTLTNGVVQKAAELTGRLPPVWKENPRLQEISQSIGPGRFHIRRRGNNPTNPSRNGRLAGG